MESYSVDEWCVLRKISRAKFYLMITEGTAPRTYHVGKRRYISAAADAAWLAAREAASLEVA